MRTSLDNDGLKQKLKLIRTSSIEDFSAAMFMSMTGISRRPFAACTAEKKGDGFRGKLLGLGSGLRKASVDDINFEALCASSMDTGFEALVDFAVAADESVRAEAFGPTAWSTEVRNEMPSGVLIAAFFRFSLDAQDFWSRRIFCSESGS